MSLEEFNAELSPDLALKYDTQSNLASDLLGGTIASVADFGASVWNSLTPESMSVSTENLLSNIDDNALRVYNENPDTIHTASFVGGMFVPTGLAFKGMNALRDGSKAASWFSKAGNVKMQENIAEAFAKGAPAADEFRGAVSALRAASWKNVAVDSVAAEMALVAAMNEHPFMEDYMKDPVKNFMIGAALGTGIGGAVSRIFDSATIRGIKSGVEQEATKIASEGYKAVDNSWSLSGQMAQRAVNVENWEGILQSTKPLAEGAIGPVRQINDYTEALLTNLIAKEKAAIVDDFDKMLSEDMRVMLDKDPTRKSALINLFTENPEQFMGIDKIRFATAAEDLPDAYKKARGLVESTILKPLGIETKGGVQTTLAKDMDLPLTQPNKKGVDKGVTMIYSPTHEQFMLSSDFKHYSVAADFVNSEKELMKGVENNWHMIPRYDIAWENAGRTTAAIDADYLKSLKYFDELPTEAFTKGVIAVSPDDISRLNAIQARVQKETMLDPDFASKVKIKITTEVPKYDEATTKIIEKVITNTITKTITSGTGVAAANAGLSTSVMQQMTKLLRGPQRFKMDLMEPSNSLSYEARALANSFSKSEMWPLRDGINTARRLELNGGGIPQRNLAEHQAELWGSDNYKQAVKSGMSHKQAMERFGHEYSNLGKYAQEILNSRETKMLKSELAKHADSEGYIYLYRGMCGKAAGHFSGESYTPDYQVALAFAKGNANNVGLYKVHLDEVIGYLGQFNSKAGGEAEIVLDVPTRVVAGKNMPVTGMQSSGHTVTEVLTGQEIKEIVKNVSSKTEEYANGGKVFESLVDAKATTIRTQLEMGVPFETIALHTNVPVDTIKVFATTGQADILSSGTLSRYTTASEISKYLSPELRSIAVSTDLARVPMARIRANVQQRVPDIADSELRNILLMGSQSEIAKALGDYLTSPDLRYQAAALRQGLDSIVASKVGGKFFTSSDFSLRHLEEHGTIIASIGKDVQRLVNERFSKLWEPMSSSFTAISKDPAATVELNIAMQVNAGIKGYREFRNGKFYYQNQDNPWIIQKLPNGKEQKVPNMVVAMYKGQEFSVKTPEVLDAMNEMGKAGRELFELRTTLNSLVGRQAPSDIGFWVPPFNPKSKFIGYVWDKVEDKTMLLHGKSFEELMAAKNAYMQTLSPEDIGRRFVFIDDKTDQRLFNKLRGRHDPIFMGSADSNMLHGGSSQSAITPTNADVLSDLANGYEHYIGYGVRSILDASFQDVLQRFDTISHMSQKAFQDQPLNIVQKFIQKPQDPGATLRNTLLGVSDKGEYQTWQSVNNLTNQATEWAIREIGSLVEPVISKTANMLGKGKKGTDAEYKQLVEQLEARGIPNPFQGMDDHIAMNLYHTQKLSDSPNMTPRILALSNSLAATVMLRFGELSQPFVNAISLPILSSGAMTRKLMKSFNGVDVDPNAKFGVISTMYNGIRYGGSIEGQELIKRGAEIGLFKPIVSEATEVLSQSRNLQPGMTTAVEKALESKLVTFMSKPADASEAMVRKQAFLTGAYMAKEAYPGISKEGQIIFARDFMDQVIGNYHASQRPVMFQGTMGVAMGLFQTYMLTMAQQIYRNIEAKDFKALAKMMLAQTTIFGTRSLPGYQNISSMIGEHFSDQNIDLTTGTYRALPSPIANLVVYGLPSNIGPAITTRGEVQPRVPNFFANGIKDIPAINMAGQAYQAADRIISAGFGAGDNVGRAVLEAVSLQSISRPMARISELFTGTSITRHGEPMYDVKLRNDSGDLEYRAILSRLMATRPLEEVKAREAYYMKTMYQSMDRAERQKVTDQLKMHLRGGDLNDGVLDKLAEEYMRTGTPQGWRAALNKAIAQTEQPANTTVRNFLRPSSPLNIMINDLD